VIIKFLSDISNNLFFINAIRRISNEHVRCSYSFAYQKRNKTEESEIDYEDANF